MSLDLIKFAFVAGEVSPSYFGRPDLEKFDLALAQGENWFVDYRGGVSTRPGSEFCDYLKADDKVIKMIDFKFSSDIANTNVIILGHQYIRFVQDGAYVLEAAKTITGITNANPGVVTATAHGFSNGDWVKVSGVVGMNNINGETFVVAGVTANTFQLQDTFGNNYNTTTLGAYVSGGTVARIYTISSPYDESHIDDIRWHQIRDTIRLTHKNYKIRNLVRLAANNWTLSIEDFSNAVGIPTGFSSVPENASSSAVGFIVTAVDEKGKEGLGSAMHMETGTNDYSINAGGVSVRWTPVVGAVYYNVYRTRIVDAASISRSLPVGFIGRARGSFFADRNITPDFTRTPPVENNPFADNRIERIDVTAAGSGYNNSSTISITDANGTGFVGYLVIGLHKGETSGGVLGVVVRQGGSGYTGPSVSTGGSGSGATFTVIRSPASGNDPAVGVVFQQRQVYAASSNDPLVLWGSKPVRLSDYSVSDILVANDSYEHELDSDSVAPIRHLVPTRGGLIVSNENGIWLLSGPNGTAVTAINAQADAQAFKGMTKLRPLKIDTDVLYAEGQGGSIRLLSYNDINKVYSGVDMSILANHLFGVGKSVKAWAYSDEPFKLVWAHREDGIGLSFTLLKEQQVYAWMRQTTKGLYKDMLSVQEGPRTSVYTIVQRYVNGRWSKFLERFAPRDFIHVEESWNVDCALQLPPTYGATTIQVAAVSGTNVNVTASVAAFVSGDVGKIIRSNGGKMEIITFNSTTSVQVAILRELTDVVPQVSPALPRPAVAGTWTMDSPTTEIYGLRHLEGQTVQVLADGNVLASKTVQNGKITIEQAASRVIAGLGFRCLLQSLPLNLQGAVIEDKRKRVVGIAARVRETRGVKYGTELDNLYEMKDRTDEEWGDPTDLQEGMVHVPIEPVWDESGQIYIIQDYPLPATVLGYVLNTEVGDDDDSRRAD